MHGALKSFVYHRSFISLLSFASWWTDSHVFGGFHFHYCLWSHCLCAAPTWVLITPIRECPFKYYITRKSCYSHHVCHEDINANSCFLLPFDACLYTKRDLFPVFIINDKQNYLRIWGLGRYIIFSSLNTSSFQWHCGVKSSSSDFPRECYKNKETSFGSSPARK